MYPNTFYRVSVKAFITNDRKEVLVVKENQEFWSLPGGGLDHGESPQECLKREINEELGIRNVVIENIVHSTTFYLDRKDAWMIWIIYVGKLDSTDFILGDGVTDAKYIDVHKLKGSEDMFEKSVFETARLLQ